MELSFDPCRCGLGAEHEGCREQVIEELREIYRLLLTLPCNAYSQLVPVLKALARNKTIPPDITKAMREAVRILEE